MSQSVPSSVASVLGKTRSPSSVIVVIDVESVAPKKSNKVSMVGKELPASSSVPYMTIVVPVRKRRNLSSIAGSPQKSCLNTAKKPTKAVVVEEDV